MDILVFHIQKKCFIEKEKITKCPEEKNISKTKK